MPDNETLSEALRWLRYAREDLDSARMMAAKEDVPARHVCWFAQQAAEKAIKAALVYLQIEFPRRHDLEVLRRLLPQDWQLRKESFDLEDLTEWSVEARYPGLWPEAGAPDATEALGKAEHVFAIMAEDLGERGVGI